MIAPTVEGYREWSSGCPVGRRGGRWDRRRRQLRRRPLPALRGAGIGRRRGRTTGRREQRAGKSDRIDALLAAKQVLAGDGVSTPRAAASAAIRVLARRPIAPASRSAPACSISCKGLHTTARRRCASGSAAATANDSPERLVQMRDRPGAHCTSRSSSTVLRDHAKRARQLDLTPARPAPDHTPVRGFTQRSWTARSRPDQRRQAAGVRPPRFRNGPGSRAGNGTAPLPASSGQTIRHRLSRGGDRQANNAIHTIALSRRSTTLRPAPTSNANAATVRPVEKRCVPQTTRLPQPLQPTHPAHLDTKEASK